MTTSDYLVLAGILGQLRDLVGAVERCTAQAGLSLRERQGLDLALADVSSDLAGFAQSLQDRQLRDFRSERLAVRPERVTSTAPPAAAPIHVQRFTMTGTPVAERHAPAPDLSGVWKTKQEPAAAAPPPDPS